MAWVLGLIGAVLLGAAGNLAYDLLKHQTLRLPRFLRVRRELTDRARSYDPVSYGMRPLVTWSKKRQLVEENLVTTFVGRADDSHFFDIPAWNAEVDHQRQVGTAGSTCYLKGISVDHGEHPGAFQCKLKIAESDYAQHMATFEIARRDPELAARLMTSIVSDLDAFLAAVPPTHLFVSVAVIANSRKLLCLRRSVSVRTGQGMWSVGINETMKYEAEPGREEDLFGLVRRGLREELGLLPSHYGKIAITWLGWSERAFGFYAVAIVRSNLDEAEIERHRGECHSVYEHDGVAWLPVTRQAISNVILGGTSPDGVHPWIYELSTLVASEVWRFRGVV